MHNYGKIDNLDKQILEIISQNARIPFKDVAAECGVSRAAIHQRVQRLIDLGVIIGSGYHVNPKSLGYSTCTYVGIKLEKVPCTKCSRTAGEDSRNRGMPLYHRSVHHADQTLLYRQRTLDGTVELPHPGDSGCNGHRNIDFSGTEHQERNSYPQRR